MEMVEAESYASKAAAQLLGLALSTNDDNGNSTPTPTPNQCRHK